MYRERPDRVPRKPIFSDRAAAAEGLRSNDDSRAGCYPDEVDSRLVKVTAVCMLVPIMGVLDVTIINVAQRTFVEEFLSTPAIVAWTKTGYTLSLAAVIPLTAWAANRFGTKRLALGSVLLFSTGSLLCAIAPDVTLLIAFRALQGLGGGILIPLSFTILAHEAGPRRLARVMVVGSIPALIAPICGPILGGWLIDSFGWQSIFLINLPIGLLTVVLAAFALPRDEPSPAEAFDFTGMLLLTPGLVALLYGVSQLPGHIAVDDPHVYVPAAAGSALMVVSVIHALRGTSHPLIDLRLLRSREVASANATRFVFAAAFSGTGLLLPGYFQQVLGKTPLQSGLLLAPQTIGAAAVMPVVGRLMEKRGPRDVVLVGTTLIVTGMSMFIYGIGWRHVHMPVLLAGLTVYGIGTGCSMIPVSWTAVQALKSREVAHGSTLFNVNHYTAVAVGAALVSVILTSLFNRSASIADVSQRGLMQGEAAKRGIPPDVATLPPQVLASDFMEHVTKDLSRAYAVVFMVTLIVAAFTSIPAWFLPTRRSRNPAD